MVGDPALLQAMVYLKDTAWIPHCCGVGSGCNSGSTPNLGTSICCGSSPKKQKKKKKKQTNKKKLRKLKNKVFILRKYLNQENKRSSSLLGIYPEKTMTQKRYMASNAHCSTAHNSQDTEATQMPVDRGVYKECGVYTQWNITQL